MQKTKLGGRFWLALTVFSLVGQVAWVVENMYFNVFIYKMFHATAAQISLMVAASAVVATLTTILIGALSDRVGKRKIFICVGYLLWGISILSFALIRVDVISPMVSAGVAVTTVCVNLTILMDCVMTFFGSTANDACFNAWLTDSTDDTNRGAAEGINAMMPMMAILVVFGGFMFFDLGKGRKLGRHLHHYRCGGHPHRHRRLLAHPGAQSHPFAGRQLLGQHPVWLPPLGHPPA